MKIGIAFCVLGVTIALFLGFLLGKSNRFVETFANEGMCNACNLPRPCGCPPRRIRSDEDTTSSIPSLSRPTCSPRVEPDSMKYVLKSSVPPCPPVPDMTRYMLKTECPSIPDMSKYVLKSSVPKCPPCISTCSKPCKIGECPPCPRSRCPVVQCPEPKACPACPSASCSPCPEPNIKCNASYESRNNVRPMLASTSVYGLQ